MKNEGGIGDRGIIIFQPYKFNLMLSIIKYRNEKGSILIFVDKQTEADELFKELHKSGYATLVLHGGQDQTDRYSKK